MVEIYLILNDYLIKKSLYIKTTQVVEPKTNFVVTSKTYKNENY